MRIAVIGFAAVAEATTRTGDETVAPLAGDETVTPAKTGSALTIKSTENMVERRQSFPVLIPKSSPRVMK
jgi:hypothetical protein